MIIALFIVLCNIAVLQGTKDGILYSLKGAEAFSWNEHIIYVLERLMLVIGLFLCIHLSYLDLTIVTISWILAYSFFHNGFYYVTRNKIDVPYYNFTFNSTSSTAKIELTWRVRLILFILSLILIGVYLYKYEQQN